MSSPLGLEKQFLAAAQGKLNSALGKAGWYPLHTLLWQLSENTNGLPNLPELEISSDRLQGSFSGLPNQPFSYPSSVLRACCNHNRWHQFETPGSPITSISFQFHDFIHIASVGGRSHFYTHLDKFILKFLVSVSIS